MQIRWGRRARIYISDEAFTAADLVVIRRTKDITTNDEADDQVAEARDLAYKVHGQGAKDYSVEFDKLLDADDSGEDIALLRDSYDNGTELFVVVCRATKDVASGKAMKFKGIVMGWSEEYPEGEAGKLSLKIVPSDPDSQPTRVTTALA
ncbi:MAG: hypothetical protein K8U03_09225 [Planctomycetia bacterium]|nr:hypothetical protein [Planctomycetia bacterium]